MRSPDAPRVLHVLRGLNRGGVEKWLVDVLRNTPPGAWSTEFLLHTREPGAYDAEVRALGGVLRYCPGTRRPHDYMRRLNALLHAHGPYDVVHSHVHLYSGVVLRAAHQAGVPVRIAHSHTTKAPHGALRRLYGRLMRSSIRTHATHCLAASEQAARTLFGPDWQNDARISVHECGLDFSVFAKLPQRELLKQQLGVPAGRVVVGQVGRFAPMKNHQFLVRAFAELIRHGVDAHLVLVGTGALEAEVRAQVEALSLTDRCMFAGGHNDVTRFYGALDLLVVPSLYEGLALVALEAQAAGVPVLASEAVPAAAQVIPGLLHRHRLDEGAATWARLAQRIIATARPLERPASARALSESRYGVARSVRELGRIYGVAPSRAGGYPLPELVS
ncbi:MAG TPA: glycosyltransferase [Longimicrobiales bacterium]|nr:glycosyltransferase [Longimicrobiales bacterium]